MKNIGIIGSGSFGCALAKVLEEKNNIKIWSYTKEEQDSINNKHECLFVPNIKLSPNTICYMDFKEVISNTDIIILVTPSNVIKNVCNEIKKYITNQSIVLASKGMDKGSLLSDIVESELEKEISIISGPSHAEQIANKVPTFVDFYGDKELISTLEGEFFKLNQIDDKVGIQVGAAFKNIISIGTGILTGLGYDSNTIAYYITEGLDEIKKIAFCLGGKENTIYGLSGLGDLLTTSLSLDSRNKRAGILLSKGKTIDEVKNEIGMSIEGLDALNSAYLLIKKYNLNTKLINNLYDIIYNNESINEII